jgi:hypothetical protein
MIKTLDEYIKEYKNYGGALYSMDGGTTGNVPVLLEKIPALYQIAGCVLKDNPSLIEIRTKEQALLFLAAAVLNNSVVNGTTTFRGLYDIETFYKKLEDVLVHFFDIKAFSPARRGLSSNRRKRWLRQLSENRNALAMLDFYKKLNPKANTGGEIIFPLLRIKNWNMANYSIEEVMRYRRALSYFKGAELEPAREHATA